MDGREEEVEIVNREFRIWILSILDLRMAIVDLFILDCRFGILDLGFRL